MTARVLAVTTIAIVVGSRGSTDSGLGPMLDDVLLAALVASLCWTTVAGVLALLGRLPGLLGRAARAGLAALLPPAARVAAATALGVQATTGAAVAAPTDGLAVERPVTSLATAVSSPPTEPPTVVVAPGDTLWDLARRHLGPDPSTAEVAAAWPRWWEANRGAIGADPDLLAVGLRLVVPTGGPR